MRYRRYLSAFRGGERVLVKEVVLGVEGLVELGQVAFGEGVGLVEGVDRVLQTGVAEGGGEVGDYREEEEENGEEGA